MVCLTIICSNRLHAQSVWTGNSGTGPDRWNRPGNWNNFLPPILPIQDAVLGDITGPTNVSVRGFFGAPTTVAPRNLRFTNVADTYTISIPNGAELRPQSITMDGSGNVTFSGGGEMQGQVLTLGELTINGSGSSLLTIDSEISNGVFNLPTILIHDRDAGPTVLNGANTHSGGTELRGGLLVLGSDSAVGTGDLSLSGGGAFH